jgi:glycosyltransferase involved in cell wall biosynthesis
MGRDLITRPYGRFFYLPYCLAKRGHEVTLLLLDYRNDAPVDIRRDGIRWISEPMAMGSPGRYTGRLRRFLNAERPDWVVGLSDTYFGILAQYYGKKTGVRSCIDAYDNYESYIPWLKPLHSLWRRALSRADLVTAAGPGLATYMSRQRHGRPAVVVPMAADPVGFRPIDRVECRSRMGLPVEGRLIGYCGSLHRNRGLEVLFRAIETLRESHPDLLLMLSGRPGKNISVPESACQLGYVEEEKIPLLLNSMDVLTVINRPSSFGNYSYPVKLYEAMACQVPVVATETPATRWVLKDFPGLLVPPSRSDVLCDRLEENLGRGRVDYGCVSDWSSVCNDFENALLDFA